ncbi:UvrD-helicase domain-containing protein [Yinghuangia sp. YIM S10712]|uniref:UvrD-helicase domain-containing protein n=1 Tax=Yinghuangia sp. YIM S10712 TaxID=3436930 RepID=UPI003F530EA0
MTPSHNNLAVIAAAGSRKTQHIVDCVLNDPIQRVLVTTYTNENLRQLSERMNSGGGLLPKHVTVMGWFSFLLNECARPYQSFILDEVGVIRGLNFMGKRPMYARKSNPRSYYLDPQASIYRNELAGFVCETNRLSNGLVIDRLATVFDHIYVDEIQDLAGYDLELLDLLMGSPIAVTVVGDPRQATFVTNTASKNKRYRRDSIADWFAERADRCTIDNRVESYRCNQQICDFADGLYPDLPATVSKNMEMTGHDGVFAIKQHEVAEYVQAYAPAVLRRDKNASTDGLSAMNIGVSKGSTFERVLIYPTQPMIKYFHTRDWEQAGDRAKLYVAVTRAKHSVAFVIP